MISTIFALKKLREETSVSFSLCKKALDQSDNDIEKAKKLLSTWGIEQTESKLLRKTQQGALFSYIHHNKKIGVLLELLCETDFVAINSEFQQLGNTLAMQIASTNPRDVSSLLETPYIKEASKIIEVLIKECIFKIGENIKIGKFVRFEI
ncbi:MAG TPA: elongation factor Ts [Patescibacteria group bacterium]|nr:elongation factor Ts [Patescibacteria group bacterium]